MRSLLVNAGLMILSMGVALLMAEGVVRLVAPQQLILIRPDLWQPADTVGWLHRPDVDVRINTGERTVSVFTDSRGFRVGPDGPTEGDIEVLLLGDSFMEALQVEHEASGAALLEDTMSAIVGRRVAVRNAGIGGWDPDQYLLRARALLSENEYDMVLTTLYLGNDVISVRRDHVPPREPVERYELRMPRSLSRGELIDALLRPLNDFLEVRSHLYIAVKNRLQTVRMALGLAAIPFPPQYLESEADSPRWEITADLCEEIAEFAQKEGAEALFVLIPTPFQVDSADLERNVRGFGLDPEAIDIDLPNRRLGEELDDRGLAVLDLLPSFREAREAGRQLYGEVDPHFTPAGNSLFAGLVGPVAAELVVSEPSRVGR